MYILITFSQVDLLKHNIPDPSLLTSSASQDKENKIDDQSAREDYIADLCFVHARWASLTAVLSFLLINKKLNDYFFLDGLQDLLHFEFWWKHLFGCSCLIQIMWESYIVIGFLIEQIAGTWIFSFEGHASKENSWKTLQPILFQNR
jgi:hypothetical protein